MANYTTRIRLEKQEDGENPNSWGLILNQNVIDLVDEAVAGYTVVSVSSVGVNLTENNGSTDQSRNLGLRLEGALTAEVTVGIPANEKLYFVYNDTTGSHNVLIKPTGGTAVTATSQGQGMLIASNGSTVDKFEGGFESGTKMLFQQSTAPSGWTKDSTHNDKALRVVTGTISTGGSTAFSTVFASKTPAGTVTTNISGNTGATTLSVNQIPSHYHFVADAGTNPGVQTLSSSNTLIAGPVAGNPDGQFAYTLGAKSGTADRGRSSSVGNTGSHTHSIGNIAGTSNFSGTSMDFNVNYVDVIIATKD